MKRHGSGAVGRPPRDRLCDGRGRARRRPPPRRLRRRRHQGRAPRGGRRHPHARLARPRRRRHALVEVARPQQAHHRTRPQGRRRPRPVSASRRYRRRGDRELSPGHARTIGARPRRPPRAQRRSRHHQGQRVRADRPLRGPTGVRHAGRGAERIRRPQRRTRRRSPAPARGPDRRGHGAGGCVRHHGRCPFWRRPGGRREPARVDAPDDGAAPFGCRSARLRPTQARLGHPLLGAPGDVPDAPTVSGWRSRPRPNRWRPE